MHDVTLLTRYSPVVKATLTSIQPSLSNRVLRSSLIQGTGYPNSCKGYVILRSNYSNAARVDVVILTSHILSSDTSRDHRLWPTTRLACYRYDMLHVAGTVSAVSKNSFSKLYIFQFSRWKRFSLSSGVWYRLVLQVDTDVSNEHTASIFKTEGFGPLNTQVLRPRSQIKSILAATQKRF